MLRVSLLVALLSVSLTALGEQLPGKVTSVITGNTFGVMCESGKVLVRLDGIDCVPSPSPYGKQAIQYAEEQVFGKNVTIIMNASETRKIQKGWVVLGDLTLEDGSSLSQKLLGEGLAKVGKASVNARYTDLEAEARQARKGLWDEEAKRAEEAKRRSEAEAQQRAEFNKRKTEEAKRAEEAKRVSEAEAQRRAEADRIAAQAAAKENQANTEGSGGRGAGYFIGLCIFLAIAFLRALNKQGTAILIRCPNCNYEGAPENVGNSGCLQGCAMVGLAPLSFLFLPSFQKAQRIKIICPRCKWEHPIPLESD